jgi:hypothetical protein
VKVNVVQTFVIVEWDILLGGTLAFLFDAFLALSGFYKFNCE